MKSKKLMAVALTATMVVGSSVTAFAEDQTGNATGAGTSFDHVNKEVLTVTLPTTADVANVFDYYVDPERVINSAKQLLDGSAVTENSDGVYFAHPGAAAVPDKNATVTSFSIGTATETTDNDSDGTPDVTVTVPATTTATKLVYDGTASAWKDTEGNTVNPTINDTTNIATPADSDFINIDPYVVGTPAGAATYTSSSEAVAFEGKNSVDVDVSVAATVTPGDSNKDITLVADEQALAAATTPALLMTLKVGTDSKAITSDGTTAKATLAGKPNNFTVTVDNNKYVYGVRTDGDANPLDAWASTSVQLVGKTNQKDIPAGDGAMTTPTINLTWTVAKSTATTPEEPEVTTTPASAVTGSGSADVLIRLISGTNADVSKITSAKVNGTDVTAANIAVSGSGNVWLKGVAPEAGTYNILVTYDGTTYSATYTK